MCVCVCLYLVSVLCVGIYFVDVLSVCVCVHVFVSNLIHVSIIQQTTWTCRLICFEIFISQRTFMKPNCNNCVHACACVLGSRGVCVCVCMWMILKDNQHEKTNEHILNKVDSNIGKVCATNPTENRSPF